MVEIVMLTTWFIMALAAIVLLFVVYQSVNQSKRQGRPYHAIIHQKRRYQRVPVVRTRTRQQSLPTVTITQQQRGPISHKTQTHLIQLVGGDQATAQRLVNAAKFTNPDRSEQWYWGKAVADLIRDRGR